jgi:hypothetical protein
MGVRELYLWYALALFYIKHSATYCDYSKPFIVQCEPDPSHFFKFLSFCFLSHKLRY